MIAIDSIQALGASIESEEEVDVAVVGGGTAGWAAAYASAKQGARTCIVESLPFLGGSMTGAMVLGSAGFRHQSLATDDQEVSFEGEQVVRGVAQDYLNRLIERGGAWGKRDTPTIKLSFDHEMVKAVLEEMMVEADVDLWFNTQFVDVVMDGQRVVGLLVSTNGGLNIIWAKAVVDSSGNGSETACLSCSQVSCEPVREASRKASYRRKPVSKERQGTLVSGFRRKDGDSTRLCVHISETPH